MTGVMRGLLQHITDLITPAGFTFSTGISTGGTPVFWQDLPATPDRAVGLTVLPVTDNPSMPLGLVLLQVRTRGNPGAPLDCDDDADAIFDVLHGVINLPYSDMSLVQVRREGSAPLGVDDQKRRERADHYEIDLDYPATTLRPGAGQW